MNHSDSESSTVLMNH